MKGVIEFIVVERNGNMNISNYSEPSQVFSFYVSFKISILILFEDRLRKSDIVYGQRINSPFMKVLKF